MINSATLPCVEAAPVAIDERTALPTSSPSSVTPLEQNTQDGLNASGDRLSSASEEEMN